MTCEYREACEGQALVGGPMKMKPGWMRWQQGLRHRGRSQVGQSFKTYLSEMVMCLGSLGGLPCPENSPAFDVQFSRRAADGHFLAFGTEWGKLVIADTRIEAEVQRDADGPVASSIRDAPSSSPSLSGADVLGTAPRSNGATERLTFGDRGIRQPAVVAEWKALPNCVFSLEWIQDDKVIALACGDNRCRLQHVETQQEVYVFKGHRGSVKSISANPLEQSVILSGSRDGSFALWDTRRPQRDGSDGRGLHCTPAAETVPADPTLHQSQSQPGIPVSPVEQVIKAHTRGGACGKRPWSYTPAPASASWVGDLNPAAGGAADVGKNAQAGRPTSTTASTAWLGGNHSVTAVAWMGDGEKFISAGQDGLVKLWDTRYAFIPVVEVQAGTRQRSRRANRSTCQVDEEVTMTTGNSPGHRPALRRVPSLYPAGGNAGSGSGGLGGVRTRRRGRGLWDMSRIRGGDVIGQEGSDGGRAYGISCAHACDDGSRIAVCTVKSEVSVYRYLSGTLRPLGSYTGNDNVSSYYVKARLSPDGNFLASGSPTDSVCIWDVSYPGAPIARLEGHVNEVTGVDWCRSEMLKLASSSDDETIRIWTVDPVRRAQRSITSSSSNHVSKYSRARQQRRSCVSEQRVAASAGMRSRSGGSCGRSWGRGHGRGMEVEVSLLEDLSSELVSNSNGNSSSSSKFGPGGAQRGESSRWVRPQGAWASSSFVCPRPAPPPPAPPAPATERQGGCSHGGGMDVDSDSENTPSEARGDQSMPLEYSNTISRAPLKAPAAGGLPSGSRAWLSFASRSSSNPRPSSRQDTPDSTPDSPVTSRAASFLTPPRRVSTSTGSPRCKLKHVESYSSPLRVTSGQLSPSPPSRVGKDCVPRVEPPASRVAAANDGSSSGITSVPPRDSSSIAEQGRVLSSPSASDESEEVVGKDDVSSGATAGAAGAGAGAGAAILPSHATTRESAITSGPLAEFVRHSDASAASLGSSVSADSNRLEDRNLGQTSVRNAAPLRSQWKGVSSKRAGSREDDGAKEGGKEGGESREGRDGRADAVSPHAKHTLMAFWNKRQRGCL